MNSLTAQYTTLLSNRNQTKHFLTKCLSTNCHRHSTLLYQVCFPFSLYQSESSHLFKAHPHHLLLALFFIDLFLSLTHRVVRVRAPI